MVTIDFDNITNEQLMGHTALSEEFKNYLISVLGYDEDEADFVVTTDFENPYMTPYISQDFEGEYTIGERNFEVRRCHTDFYACGLFHLAEYPAFEFYMLFDTDTLEDDTVGSYDNADKMYLTDHKYKP